MAMDKSKFFTATVLSAVLSIPTIVNAALVGRLAATEGGADYQAYYDTEANLTWLADANYAMTSGYDADGRMIWADSVNWVAGLSVGGVGDWRLPSTDTCSDTNCTSSEMGNLYYNVLGGTSYDPLVVTHNANYYLFSNVQISDYWSDKLCNNIDVYSYNIDIGAYGCSNTLHLFSSWAMQSGDVSAVPIPSAVWLFGSGLIGLVGLARRKSNA